MDPSTDSRQSPCPDRAGGVGMTVGLIVPPVIARGMICDFPPEWHTLEMWHPSSVATHAGSCHVVVVFPDPSGDEEDRLAVTREAVILPGIPVVVYGSLHAARPWLSAARSVQPPALALPMRDDRHLPEIVLDCAWGPLLREVAAAVRQRTDADPELLDAIAGLIEWGVRPFRDAAELMTVREAPFPRLVKHLGDWPGGGQRIRKLAAQAGVDLRGFLRQNVLLQGALRYLPGRSYQLGVRLGFRTREAFRMAMTRGLGVGLSDIHAVAIDELVQDLLDTLSGGAHGPGGATSEAG